MGGMTCFSAKLLTGALFAAALLAGCASPKNVTLSMPDLAKIPDGTYRGSATVFPVAATVEVTVQDHRITGYRIVQHTTGKGQAAEALAGQVVEKQTVQLDAVSGATYSSKAILKAGENALSSALPR